ncbi:MAG: acetyltransferase [Candidatus Omnitrophica bacterium]|nr:acetyltransferase [Candidatus Omnitrophota bacterium]
MKNRPVVLIGAGGHAKVLVDALRLLKINVVGAADLHLGIQGFSVPLIGKDEDVIKKYKPGEIYLVNGVAGTRVSPLRQRVYERFKKRKFKFLSVIHPSAVIAKDVKIGEGAQVMAGAVIQTGSLIGENSIINTRASVDHDCHVGAHVHIAPGAILCGGVRVGDGCHVGAGAILIQNARIREKQFIKAGERVQGEFHR